MTARGCKRPCRHGALDISKTVSPFVQGVPKARFMVIVKATKDSEAGFMPRQQLLTDMGKFNEELAQADILLAGEGLHPSSKFFAAVPPERSLSYGCSGENPRY